MEEIKFGVMSLPVQENGGGDAYVVKRTADKVLLAVVDGLGHGQGAHAAAQKAVQVLQTSNSTDLEYLLEAAHGALRNTVGVVAGLVLVDAQAGKLGYIGVGNITLKLVGKKTTWLPLPAGILGYGPIQKIYREVVLSGDEVLLMHTDGIKEDYQLGRVTGPGQLVRNIAECCHNPGDDALILAATELLDEGWREETAG